jgi:hypothetical protein
MRKTLLPFALLAALAPWTAAPAARADSPAGDFFNGKNLDGWEGLIDKYWSVKEGAIVGYTP